MQYKAVLKGKVNGQDLLVQGRGTIIDGTTKGKYLLVKRPIDFDSRILKAVMITGYPNACRSLDGSHNVFKGKSYDYMRQLRFNNGGLITFSARCVLDGDNLDSLFELEGNLDCETINNDSEPIIETWQPNKENHLSGLFRISWKTLSGYFLTADAHSIYRPEGVSQEHPILHRYIGITSRSEGDTFYLHQNSMLFHNMDFVNDGLAKIPS